MLPVLTYTAPHAAPDALRWRHVTIPTAVQRARQLGLHGAAFPWRTINGVECSGYWPAGTAAFHVNADIADAAIRLVQATGDDTFDRQVGLSLLVHTARLWISLGFHHPHDGFRIDGVTGPDEYSAVVDNNVYTNLMAQRNLLGAVAAAKRHPYQAARLGVDDAEIAAWQHAAEAMTVPYDERYGIHPQDENFTQHEVWDFAQTRPDQYPLLLHFPYFDLYRKQVVKQADLVLALYKRADAFTPEQKARDFAYYEPLTVRDSSLANVLSALPKSAHPGAKRALAEIWNAEDREHARRAVAAFRLAYGAKFGKAVAKVTNDLDELLAFYDFPAEHWVHLRTTNPISSRPSPPCATARRSPRVLDPRRPASRWPSSSSRPPRPAGARSTHPTSSPWSVPAPASNTASSSNAQPPPPRP